MNQEKILLGGIIKTPFHIDIVASKLSPEDFLDQQNQVIYKKILEIYRRKGFFDYYVLEESADNNEQISYLLELLGESHEFNYQELSQYISKIKEAKKVQKLKQLGTLLSTEKTFATNSADWLMDQVTKKLFDITGESTAQETTQDGLIQQLLDEIEKNKNKELWGFTTGLKELDRCSLGMQAGQIWVIGAYTSVGKSWFCLHLARSGLNDGAKVLYLSTEMTERRLAWRFLTMETGLREYDMIKDRLSIEQAERRAEAMEKLKASSIKFVSGITKVDQVIFHIKKELAAKNCDLVVVDFIQNLATGREEYEELSDAIRKMQALAIQENICIIVASQVNRESQKSGLGGTFGYKGSGTIEASADIGIILKKKEESEKQLEVNVKKNRNGFTTDFVIEADFARGSINELS